MGLTRILASWVFLLGLFAAFAYIAVDGRNKNESLVGQPADVTPPITPPSGGTPGVLAPRASHPAGADERPSPSGQAQREHQPSGPSDSPEGVSYDAVAASRIFERYDEKPEETILWGTVDIWTDPGFQSFVGDRVSSYPTAEDARLALESRAVQEAYFAFLVADGVAVEFELSPDAPRDLVENARRAYLTAEVDLWRAMDRNSVFRDWERLGMLWRSYDLGE